MSEHTKEPWRLGNTSSVVADEPVIGMNGSDAVEYYGGHLICESVVPSNASRIVACVNACAGIPDNVLEKAAECAASGRFGTMAAMYKAQRDELLAALQMALADHMTEPYLHPLRDGTVEAIRCAIANAENPPCA